MTIASRIVVITTATLIAGLCGCGSHAKKTASAEHGPAHAPAHWGYTGEASPANWSALSPEYGLCAGGHCQSPIDITAPRGEDLANIEFDYAPSAVNIVNNGHTVQVNYDPGSHIVLDGKRYGLAQFHFHSPSEHRVAGRAYAAEMHLVHKADDGELAVVAVFITPGANNPAFGPVWSQAPETAGPVKKGSGLVDAGSLLPGPRGSYRYGGSLTTPPCSEGVKWTVLTTPVEMSEEQIRAFTKLYSGNNRPVRPLEGREVVQDRTP